jgi:hypothetical protein
MVRVGVHWNIIRGTMRSPRVGGGWEVAFRDMLVTQPTTREGALALIDCFLETEREMIGKDCLALLTRLSGFLRQAA